MKSLLLRLFQFIKNLIAVSFYTNFFELKGQASITSINNYKLTKL